MTWDSINLKDIVDHSGRKVEFCIDQKWVRQNVVTQSQTKRRKFYVIYKKMSQIKRRNSQPDKTS